MSIDQSLIYAKRFETNPTPLKQAVLGASPQGLDIDPYTALRALQHIDQARQMQMAQQAQQAPAANAQPSIADATLAKTFGNGGIVAFAMGGTPMQHYAIRGLTDSDVSDEEAYYRRQQAGDDLDTAGTEEDGVKSLVGTDANPDIVKQGMYDLQNRPKVKFGDRNEETKALAKMYAEAGGPDIYGPELERLKAREGEGLKAKDQGLGLSLLKAAAAMSQGNNLGRAAANAAGAFGESYNEMIKQSRAEQEHRDAMRFHLADAQRKDKLGQFSLAANATHQGRMEAIAAQNAEDKRLALQVQLQALGNRGAKTGAQINPTNLLYGAQTAYDENPTKENLSKLNAAKKAIEATNAKTNLTNVYSGYVGGEQPKGKLEEAKVNTLSAAQEETAVKNAEKEIKDSTGYASAPALNKLKRTNPTEYDTQMNTIRRNAYIKHGVEHKLKGLGNRGGSSSAPPSGYTLDQ
jgi:hypothetical protein